MRLGLHRRARHIMGIHPQCVFQRLEGRRLLSGSAGAVAMGQGVTLNEGAGQPFYSTVATFAPGELSGDLSNFKAVVHWGDGTQITGTLAAKNDGSVKLKAGFHAYAHRGDYTVRINVRQASGTHALVAQANGAVDVGAAPIQGRLLEAVAGQSFTAALGTFSLTSPTPADMLSANIFWGDGSPGEFDPGTVQATQGDKYRVVGTHDYEQSGYYEIDIPIYGPPTQSITPIETPIAEVMATVHVRSA
jgi:hypothetical protein